ncbi:tRNA 2-selenouridine(34) synthase MnmH [uncultured Paracoccus sp.]|uniref:tRNA 2-selenouridine(34) synthase MnmH n=1 Tax=uncultured Paracoccus sp. TaxID=189685 RepID=UPI002604BFC0|nr:tRNA 2-selenouridine(34) synthase MnmH [uncultured Paracoccus sp.]
MPAPRIFRLTALTDPALAGFDDVIDVRSPAEHADDHLPGSINLPVLDDAQRAQVGTIHKQESPFAARRIGGALVAANTARHVAGPLADRDGSWQPLVHCWRGGQRSGAFATILAQIGWRVSILDGGWKTWRRLVLDQVEQRGPGSPVLVVDGNTGSAKTAILERLAARGVQVIDLEGLANHRGSLFGAMPGGQPPQKLFESRLAMTLARLDPARPVVVEAESSRIGTLAVPRAMWRALCAAPRVRLDVPVAARAAYTADVYADTVSEPGRVDDAVQALSRLHPATRIAEWRGLVRQQDWATLAEALMREHYDPRYRSHRDRFQAAEIGQVELPSLDPAAQYAAAARIEAVLDSARFRNFAAAESQGRAPAASCSRD